MKEMSRILITNSILNGFLLKEKIKTRFINNIKDAMPDLVKRNKVHEKSLIYNRIKLANNIDRLFINITGAFRFDCAKETKEISETYWQEINLKYKKYLADNNYFSKDFSKEVTVT